MDRRVQLHFSELDQPHDGARHGRLAAAALADQAEGLARLQQMGLIEVRHGSGSVVSNPTGMSHLRDKLPSTSAPDQPGLGVLTMWP